MPSLSSILTLLRYAAVAAVIGVIGFLWFKHEHDQKTIASQEQLLAQAGTQQSLDTATIAQLRTDIAAQSDVIGKLGETTVAAFQRAQDAELAAAKADAMIEAERQKLQKKHDDPAAVTKSCHDAIEEWRSRL